MKLTDLMPLEKWVTIEKEIADIEEEKIESLTEGIRAIIAAEAEQLTKDVQQTVGQIDEEYRYRPSATFPRQTVFALLPPVGPRPASASQCRSGFKKL